MTLATDLIPNLSSEPITIGILGGSGLYQMEALTDVKEVALDTPFGPPSDSLISGRLGGARVVFLARHGRGHRLLPSEIPYRANIHAFKQLGVRYLISASAVGSLQEGIRPLDMVVPDQFIDRTQHRQATFFGDGIVAHVGFGDPVCSALAGVVARAASQQNFPDLKVHRGGTYVCMEGPAFSTRAESHLYRQWGAQIIGMTNLTEAKLAREAEIAYATLALVTDYDCWRVGEAAVSVEMVIGNLHKNARHAQQVVAAVVTELATNPPPSEAHQALKYGLFTDLSQADPVAIAKLKPLLAPYLP